MSAVVAPLARDEVFWFLGLNPKFARFHAFELVRGELSSGSICGNISASACADIPSHDDAERKGRGCFFCLMLVSQ